MPTDLFHLDRLGRFGDFGPLLTRVVTGAFLVHGTQDNVFSAERMDEFVTFLARFGFPAPDLLAPLSVYLQFGCGLLFIAGLLVRWAGLTMAVNFVVAIAMVHWSEGFRGWWPALALILISADLMLRGGGRFSLDHLLRTRTSGQRGAGQAI